MAALTSEEQEWLQQNAKYWGITPVSVEVNESVHDIAYQNGTVLLGKEFLKDKPNSFMRKQKLSHEMLHHLGVIHSDGMREMGYFSKPGRDRLSRKIVHDIEQWDGTSVPYNRWTQLLRTSQRHNPDPTVPFLSGNSYLEGFSDGDGYAYVATGQGGWKVSDIVYIAGKFASGYPGRPELQAQYKRGFIDGFLHVMNKGASSRNPSGISFVIPVIILGLLSVLQMATRKSL